MLRSRTMKIWTCWDKMNFSRQLDELCARHKFEISTVAEGYTLCTVSSNGDVKPILVFPSLARVFTWLEGYDKGVEMRTGT